MDMTDFLVTRSLDSRFPLPRDRPFTTAQARQEGVPRWQLDPLVSAGVLRRPIKGVFVAAALDDSILLRTECLRLVVPEDAVVVDRHAGYVQGAEMVLAPNEHLDLQPMTLYQTTPGARLRNVLVDSGERTLLPEDITEINGLRVTTPLRTALDLGRVRRVDRAIAAVDAMLRLGRFSHAELQASVPRFRGQRWVTTLRAVVPIADGRAESPPESVLRLRCIECGLAMTPQVEVFGPYGEFVARLDLANKELMAAAEYDGAEWHSSPAQQQHDRERRAAAAEVGYLVEPFTAENLYGHHRDVEDKLYALKEQARRRLGRPAC